MIEIEAHIGERGISARGFMRGPTVKIDALGVVTIEHAISLLNPRPSLPDARPLYFRHVETPWGGVRLVERDEDGATYRITIDDAGAADGR